MRERNDYVVPHFNEAYRFDKPPLTYWAQTASYHWLGETDFAARLPTAIAAALVALVIYGWGRRIADDRVGLWAAIIFTLCLQTFIHGKAAVADMWLVLFVTLAHWAGYELMRCRRGPEIRPWHSWASGWWWIFWVSLALAFLAKGPIGWTPILTVLAMGFLLREVKVRKQFGFVTGIALMLLIVSAWGIPALLRTHGEFFYVGIGKHVVGRSLMAMEGHGSKSPAAYLLTLPFFFFTVFLSFFPWSIKLLRLVRGLWRERDLTDIYLLLGAGVIFVIFTLVKTKLLHYTLPALPLISLLAARQLVPRETRFLKIAAWAMGSICLIASLVAFPLARSLFPTVQLFDQSRADLRPEMEFAGVEFIEPSLVWYFRRETRGWFTKLDPATVKIFMEAPGGRFVVLPTSLAARLYPALPNEWKSYRTNGYNFVKGKRMDLTMLLKPPRR